MIMTKGVKKAAPKLNPSKPKRIAAHTTSAGALNEALKLAAQVKKLYDQALDGLARDRATHIPKMVVAALTRKGLHSGSREWGKEYRAETARLTALYSI